MATREAWLLGAAQKLLPMLAECCPNAAPSFSVSVGFPKGSRGGKRRAIGQCWNPQLAKDGKAHIFISPELDDPLTVLATLLHELIHAAVGNACGHKGAFVKAARSCGLVKPWTATTPSEELAVRLNELAARLGAYPHGALQVQERPKPGSRLRLYECNCGKKIRHAGDELIAVHVPCGTQFQIRRSA